MAIFHLSLTSASRKHGGSAAERRRYVCREGRYEDRRDLAFAESQNMPAWVPVRDVTSTAYWQAADEHERANGRLYIELEAALPRELTLEQQIELCRLYVDRVTAVEEGHLPTTWAIHDKGDGNPHVHILVSERANDGHSRTPEQWFSRAVNAKRGNKPIEADASKAGARKCRRMKRDEWLVDARAAWAEVSNRFLELAGSAERISHLSLAAQGIERQAQLHVGPAVWVRLQEGREHELSTESRTKVAHNRSVALAAELASAERELSEALLDQFGEQLTLAAEMAERAEEEARRAVSPVIQSITHQPVQQETSYAPTYQPTYARSGARGAPVPTPGRRTLGRAPTLNDLRTLSGSTLARDARPDLAGSSAGAVASDGVLPSDAPDHLELEREAPVDGLRRDSRPSAPAAGARSGLTPEAFQRLVESREEVVGDVKVRPLPATRPLSIAPTHYEAKQGRRGVLYVRRPDDIFCLLDTGRRIKVRHVDQDSARACVALAAEKWGSFQLNGSDEFKAAAMAEAVRMNLSHLVTNPELQHLVVKRSAPAENSSTKPTVRKPRAP